jgi:hypothetical protein
MKSERFEQDIYEIMYPAAGSFTVDVNLTYDINAATRLKEEVEAVATVVLALEKASSALVLGYGESKLSDKLDMLWADFDDMYKKLNEKIDALGQPSTVSVPLYVGTESVPNIVGVEFVNGV